MKKADVKVLRTVTIPDDKDYKVPEGWQLLKDPTKVSANGVDVFQIVIGKANAD